jgi:hypothetical protein
MSCVFGSMVSGDEVTHFGEARAAKDSPSARAQRIANAHAQQTKMLWLRRALEEELVGHEITPCYGRDCGKTKPDDRDQIFFLLTPSITCREATPWSPQGEVAAVRLFSMDNGKMRCPSFSLPAGATQMGGSCPGADGAQLVLEEPVRLAKEEQILPVIQKYGCDLDAVDLNRAICNICYALTGRYQYSNIQLEGLVRYAWITRALAAKRYDSVVEVLDAAITGLKSNGWHPQAMASFQKFGKYIFRLHDAGDFFSFDYADAWIEIARKHQDIVFWAPTRTWVKRSWLAYWAKADLPENLIVRASAYHVGDRAPRGLPGLPAGTTSLYAVGGKAPNAPEYAQWNCHAYDVRGDKHTCQTALSPDGSPHCRVCWMQPDVTVNFTAHS